MRNPRKYYRHIDELTKILQYEHGTLPITRKILNKYKHNFNWDNICRNQHLTEAMIEDFQHYMNWDDICQYQTLSENFIRNHQDLVNWGYITKRQFLSTKFIREFQDYVDWNIITYRYPLSDNFVDEFHKKIDWTTLICERVHMIDFNWVEELKKRYNVVPVHVPGLAYCWKEKGDL